MIGVGISMIPLRGPIGLAIRLTQNIHAICLCIERLVCRMQLSTCVGRHLVRLLSLRITACLFLVPTRARFISGLLEGNLSSLARAVRLTAVRLLLIELGTLCSILSTARFASPEPGRRCKFSKALCKQALRFNTMFFVEYFATDLIMDTDHAGKWSFLQRCCDHSALMSL